MTLSRRDVLAGAGALAVASVATAAEEAPLQTADSAGAASPPTTWNLTDLYLTPEAWSADLAAMKRGLGELADYKGKLGSSAAALRAALQTQSDLARKVQRLNLYASLLADSDTSIAVNQERRQLATSLKGALAQAGAYIQPEILQAGAAKIAQFQAAEPGLDNFGFLLADTLRLTPHTLSVESEGVITAAATPLAGIRQIRTQLVESDIPWPEVTLSTGTVTLDQATFTAQREAPEREDRKRVFDAFFSTFDRYKTSLATVLAAQVQSNVFSAKARRYGSAVEASLSAAGNVPVSVYRALVDEANRGLPQLHRYFEVRRTLLGLPDLHYYDMYPPLVKLDESFDLARIRALTLDALTPLGKRYGDTLARATASPWGDYLPRKNKISSAYENNAYRLHPYLLLNLTGNYKSLTTFAHEWGHAMHSILADEAQPFETADYPILTAEIASTLNEQLVGARMFGNARTKPQKIYYLGQLLELFRTTFFRQAMFAEFELAIHETVEKGGALSGETLNAMYLGLLRRYHGPGVTIDPVSASEWAYTPHYYYNFYVYQYAVCISVSAFFHEQIAKGGAKERENYLSILRAGGSDYPINVIRKAGLDMTTPAPYRATVERFGRMLDQLEALI